MFLDPIVDAVHDQTYADLGRDIDIKIQSWGDEAWAVGAATLVLRELFNLPGSDDRSPAIWHRDDYELLDETVERDLQRG